MNEISLFRQQRFDEGIRTGIGVNGHTVFHLFEVGQGEPDPALLWYIDVSFQGEHLSTDITEAKAWLLNQAPVMRQALKDAAQHLSIGLDADSTWPFRTKLTGFADDVTAELTVSGVRRLSEKDLAERLGELSENWNGILTQLQPLETV